MINLLSSFGIYKFALNSFQICFVYVSDSLLIRYKFASKFAPFLSFFLTFALICFRKFFPPFNSFPICFRSMLICSKMETICQIQWGNWYFGRPNLFWKTLEPLQMQRLSIRDDRGQGQFALKFHKSSFLDIFHRFFNTIYTISQVSIVSKISRTTIFQDTYHFLYLIDLVHIFTERIE